MRLLSGIGLMLCAAVSAIGQNAYRWESGGIRSAGKDDQIEVGGPLAGAEFHGSRPLPSRISLYAPVANSIDLSTDYWQRGDSRPLLVGIKVDEEPRRWLGKEPWEYLVQPHAALFEQKEGALRYSLRYDFGSRDVAAALTFEIRNEGDRPRHIELYTHLVLALRSCQSYHRIPAAGVRFSRVRSAIVGEFNDPRLSRAALFVQNVGALPHSWSTNGKGLAVRDSGWSNWIERGGPLSVEGGSAGTPIAAFTYRATLEPGDSLRVVQIIGSTKGKEVSGSMNRAARDWQKEVKEYAARIESARSSAGFQSGDGWTDSSVAFSRALLEANQHYLDGSIVPMPCPAEYNFFFTHDLLLTNLSAVMFDPARVRRDLLYLFKYSKNNDLPHAYYWKDDGFKTEFCNAGNWNNLWVILASAAYYRHTGDDQTVRRLYPLLARSLEKTLTMRKGNVLHGIEPDWWDFGNAPGARAYLTILTTRALEEFVFLSARLRERLPLLASYERMASELRRGLVEELWGPEGYLFNTTSAGLDRHIYMGPLLGAVYDLLPGDLAAKLVATAGRRLLDPAVGIRTVWPADFHTDSTRAFYRVKSNEAGNQYRYANGGIWYLGNAWYAWALRSVGDVEGAFDFYRRTMTLDGILQSPYGQPGLYEYRYADALAADHGRIDKPSMMWSAGFCIGTAYRMAGFEDNVWNVSVAGAAPAGLQDVTATFAFGGKKVLRRSGKGSMVTRLTVDGNEIPSRILPLDAGSGAVISVEMGPIRYPFLDSVNAVLHSASFEPQGQTLKLALSSFSGHATAARFITPRLVRSVLLNGQPWKGWSVTSTPVGTLIVTVQFPATAGTDQLSLQF